MDSFTISRFLLLSLFLMMNLLPCKGEVKDCRFEAIYSFGDSIADTGNLILQGDLGSFSAIQKLPYGQTYFNRPTGRCSDGLLIVDFVAMSLGLPHLNPYLEKDAEFGHGVNFAVAGGTALKASYFTERNMLPLYTNNSLEVQLDWFKTHLKSVFSSQTEYEKRLEKSLFLVGEIGGNDYNYPFFQGKSIEELKSFVPDVIQVIKDVAREVIQMGAMHLIIPGNFPIGCMPSYLTMFQSSDEEAYDENKCLKDLNDFAEYHNEHIQKAIEDLRQEFPQVLIFYADYFNCLKALISNPKDLGFEEGSTLKACCGSGGDYNFDVIKMCGLPGVSVCDDSSKYISWDGIHLTQEAYKNIAEIIINDAIKEWNCKREEQGPP